MTTTSTTSSINKPILMVYNPQCNRWEELYSYEDLENKSDSSVVPNNSDTLTIPSITEDSGVRIVIPGDNGDKYDNYLQPCYTRLSDICVPIENSVETPSDLLNDINNDVKDKYVTPASLKDINDGITLELNPSYTTDGGTTYTFDTSLTVGDNKYFAPARKGANGDHLVWKEEDGKYWLDWAKPTTTVALSSKDKTDIANEAVRSLYTPVVATFGKPNAAICLSEAKTSFSTANHCSYVEKNSSDGWKNKSINNDSSTSFTTSGSKTAPTTTKNLFIKLKENKNNDFVVTKYKQHTYVLLLNQKYNSNSNDKTYWEVDSGCIKINKAGKYLISFQADCYIYSGGYSKLTASSKTNVHFGLQKKSKGNNTWKGFGSSSTSHLIGIGSHTISVSPRYCEFAGGDLIRLVMRNDSNTDTAFQANHSQIFITVQYLGA